MDRENDSDERDISTQDDASGPIGDHQMDIRTTEVVRIEAIPAAPHLAPVESVWSRSVRTLVIGVIIVACLVYLLFGTVLARNVTFNRLIDEGAYNGIRRFRRESIMDVWRTMWDRAPDLGSVDLTRAILLVSTVAFFAAFALIIMLVFIPSRQEWAAGLGEGQESDTISGD